jgi:hypothetical protein
MRVYEKVVGRARQRRKKGVSSWVRLGRDLAFESIEEKERNLPTMETNETPKREQYQGAEQELIKAIEEIEGIEEGNLKELEEKIYQILFRIGRKLMESRINNGKESESAPTKIQGECGHDQKLVGYRTKKLLTLFGEVGLKRAYYQCQMVEGQEEEGEQVPTCSHGRAPADEIWGVQGKRTTPGVQQYISYLCSMLTFDEAAETFRRFLPGKMSARQALNLSRPVGRALAEKEDEEVKCCFDQASQSKTDELEREQQPLVKDIARLYIEPDGIMGRMRRESVPMEKNEQERKGDVYRETRVGATFLAERGNERSELAPGVWIDTPKEGSQQYVARRTARGGFDQLLYTLACQSGLGRAEQVVVIGDGAHWIWDLAEEHFAGAVQIVDLYHAQEHVWDVAHAVFGRTTQKGISWAKHACDLLVHGQIEDLVALISQLSPIAPPPGKSKSIPEQAIGYFTTNAQRMRYPTFRAQGMHVGSGIAEAACKRVVTTRFKQTGMRWTPDGLDAILPLRTAKLNRTYDQFWQTQSRLIA